MRKVLLARTDRVRDGVLDSDGGHRHDRDAEDALPTSTRPYIVGLQPGVDITRSSAPAT